MLIPVTNQFAIGVLISAPPSLAERTFDGAAFDGLVDWMGTNGGAQAFANPAASPVDYPLAESASSTNSSIYSADNAFDHSLAAGLNEGVYASSDTPGSWLQADFGTLRIRVDHYAIWGRESSTFSALDDWELQGSQDASAWTTLDSQTNNPIPTAGSFATSVPDDTYWRYLRVLMTAPNASGNNVLFVPEIEWWGALTEAA